jgi:flagellar biosynthetic protein FlhB
LAEGREDRSREDLTEEASPHRLEEYRRKGMVAQSRELSGLAVLIAAAGVTYMTAPKIASDLGEFMKSAFKTDFSSKLDLSSNHLAAKVLIQSLHLFITAGLPICAAGFIIGIVSSFAQIGAIFSVDPLTPDIDKINPLQGLMKLLSVKQLIESIRLIAKVITISVVTYIYLKSEILGSPQYTEAEPGFLLLTCGRVAQAIFIALVIVIAIFAVIDFAFQKHEYGKNLRMTKQEAKQEHKEREGDPHIRGRIRAIQREMARKRMMQAVKKADVIVTNPTHIAVAIVYDKSDMAAPKVVAKGADFLAQKIKQVAMDAGVPLVENVPLARTLYKTVKVGQVIPRALYQAVAEVLAYVYRLKNRRL